MQAKVMVAHRAVPVLSAVAILLGKSVVAAACTAPPYEEVFVPSGTVPSDGFAAEIGEPGRSLPALLDDAGAPVELVTTQGPASRWTVKPTQALVPGTHYTFRFQRGRWLHPTDTVPQSVDFDAGPPAPAPESAGTLQIEADPPGAASDARFFHVEWDRALALQAYASLLEVHFMVDGMRLSTLSSSQSTATVSGMCEGAQPAMDSCGDLLTVLAGRHTVTLTARVFGSAAPLPPPSASLDVQCPPPTLSGEDSPAPHFAGCAVAGASADAPFTGTAVAMALTLALSRRRRRFLA